MCGHRHKATELAVTWVILLWLARNMDRFWDSWMDWGSAIFLKNCAALQGGGTAQQSLIPMGPMTPTPR